MNETAQPRRGGRAFHSILEPHFDFIRELRRGRKTWKEIAEALSTEKGIRVTLYAPYRFYRRQLKRRAKGHWEDVPNPISATSRPAKAAGNAFNIGEQFSAFPPQTPKPQYNDIKPGHTRRFNDTI